MMIKVKHNMNYITIYKCSQKDIILKKMSFFYKQTDNTDINELTKNLLSVIGLMLNSATRPSS